MKKVDDMRNDEECMLINIGCKKGVALPQSFLAAR